jgi:methylenetetrahydrofolate reductase (NADPH)
LPLLKRGNGARAKKAILHMENEVPGIRIPKSCFTRMENAEDENAEGVKTAVEMILALREIDGVQGIHLMPLMRESVRPRILDEAGLLIRWGMSHLLYLNFYKMIHFRSQS